MNVGGIGSNAGSNTVSTTAANKASDDNFEARLQKAMNENDEKELKKACRDFEGIMLNMMYKQMKATVPKSEIIPDESGREIFESMLDEKLMEEVSKNGGLGLSDVMYNQLSKRLKSSYVPVKEGSSKIEEK